MDVDLLRPGTVPISSDTVLWFEFLLDPDLLLKHLKKDSSDPSPTELITKFYDVITDTLKNKPELDNGDAINVEQTPIKHSAKNIALKILSLKVAAYFNWNMSKIRLLPFKTQINLLQDLMYFTNGNVLMEIPAVEVANLDDLSLQYLFALIVFHRWLLYTTMYRITSNWQLRFGPNDISPTDESYICSPENVQKTVTFLTQALEWRKIPQMLTFDCFKLPTERNHEQIEFDWKQCTEISRNEFVTQLNYDLGMFFFYKEQYDLGKKHFGDCMKSFRQITERGSFVQICSSNLDAYVHACNGAKVDGSLLEQLNASIFNQYTSILSILQQDNIRREIPLVHRLNLELNIQGALSSGAFTAARDLLQKIKALNMIRCILDGKPLYQYANMCPKHIDTIIWAIQITWHSFDFNGQNRIKNYLTELILGNQVPDLLNKLQSNDMFKSLFDKADLQYFRNAEFDVEVPVSLTTNDFNALYDFSKKRKPQSELRQLELQLISTNNHSEVRKILSKMQKLNNGNPIWTVNPLWELPIPLQSVIKSLQRGFLQDFAFVMLAKSKQQLMNRNWNSSLELLIILDKELQMENMQNANNVQKLIKLVSWEILLIKITQLLTEWSNSIDKPALANACEACLQTSDSILPRTEITEQCIVCLLNLRRWEFLINYDKRWSTCEISAAIALACHEIVVNKGGKKLSKNLWDLILPIFLSTNSQQSKRATNHDITTLKTNLMEVFYKLREPIVLAVVVSLLTKMFNVLKDEPSLELQVEHANLWPYVISNANSYSSQTVSELLSEMVLQALKYNPTNVAWLRLMGDINYANNHYRNSLNYYLKSLLIYNEYFNIPIRNDDHVFRRMIKCCTSLGCNTQAAVLCQFLEDPDYTLAFRILSDQKTCNDAVDAYYHCFWDTNILEYLIYVHNKKGEFQRRKCAIQVIGLLELNSNNNEEIQREASNLRKSTFLRAMCKQYVL